MIPGSGNHLVDAQESTVTKDDSARRNLGRNILARRPCGCTKYDHCQKCEEKRL